MRKNKKIHQWLKLTLIVENICEILIFNIFAFTYFCSTEDYSFTTQRTSITSYNPKPYAVPVKNVSAADSCYFLVFLIIFDTKTAFLLFYLFADFDFWQMI